MTHWDVAKYTMIGMAIGGALFVISIVNTVVLFGS